MSGFFFRKKVRVAVYEALNTNDVMEGMPLFKPCFKRLFEIVMIFAQDMPNNQPGFSTKSWLAKIAMQNVDTIVSIEKAKR